MQAANKSEFLKAMAVHKVDDEPPQIVIFQVLVLVLKKTCTIDIFFVIDHIDHTLM